MGLFSHKYGEKDYIKNAAIFADRIQQISELIMEEPTFKRSLNVINAAKTNRNVSMVEREAGLEETEYSSDQKLRDIVKVLNDAARKYNKKSDGKMLEALDARIEAQIESLLTDIQEKEAARFCEHVEMLRLSVCTARKYCNDQFTTDDLENQEKMAIAKGAIDKFENRRNNIVKLQDEIFAEMDGMSEETKEYRDAEREYEELENEKNEIDVQLEDLNDAYDTLYDNHLLALADTTNKTLNAITIDVKKLAINIEKVKEDRARAKGKISAGKELFADYKKDRESERTTRGTSALKSRRDLENSDKVARAINGTEIEVKEEKVSALKLRRNGQ